MAARMMSVLQQGGTLEDQEAQPFGGGNELRHDDADDGQRDGDLEAGEQMGVEAGRRTSQKVRHGVAMRPRHSRTSERSVDSRPAIMAMKIGKKPMKVAMVSRDCQPMPTQTMNSGVQAIFGDELDDDDQGIDRIAQQAAEAQQRGKPDAEQGRQHKAQQRVAHVGRSAARSWRNCH